MSPIRGNDPRAKRRLHYQLRQEIGIYLGLIKNSPSNFRPTKPIFDIFYIDFASGNDFFSQPSHFRQGFCSPIPTRGSTRSSFLRGSGLRTNSLRCAGAKRKARWRAAQKSARRLTSVLRLRRVHLPSKRSTSWRTPSASSSWSSSCSSYSNCRKFCDSSKLPFLPKFRQISAIIINFVEESIIFSRFYVEISIIF